MLITKKKLKYILDYSLKNIKYVNPPNYKVVFTIDSIVITNKNEIAMIVYWRDINTMNIRSATIYVTQSFLKNIKLINH